MRKIYYCLFLFITATISTEAGEWELKDHPVLTFYERLVGDANYYEVKLKAVKMRQEDYNKSLQSITISYITTINYPLSEEGGTIYIRLTDKEGFEITSKMLDRVVENYTGTIKGNFTLKPNEYQKISGAELSFRVRAD